MNNSSTVRRQYRYYLANLVSRILLLLLLLCLAATNNNGYHVHGLLQQQQQQQQRHSTKNYNNRITRSTRHKSSSRQEQLSHLQQERRSNINNNHDVTSSTATTTKQQKQRPNMMQIQQEIIRLGRRGNTDEALHLYHSLDAKPSVRVWNAAIDTCARARPTRVDEAFRLLEEGMKEKELTPNVFTFGSLTSACARARQADRAIYILRSMKRNYNVSPNAIIYSSAISACSRATATDPSKYRTALKLLEEAEQDVTIDMNVIGYNAALGACANAAAYEAAMDLLQQMESDNSAVRPDPISYGTVMAACEKAEQWDHVLEYAKKMHSLNMPMDGLCLTSALHACQQKGLVEEASLYLNEMKELKTSSRRQTAGWERKGARGALEGPDGVAYRLAISACARGGDWQRGIALLEEMKQVQKPDVMAYTAAITGCEYAGEWRQAFVLLDQMRSSGVLPNEVTFSAIIGACATACAKQYNTNEDEASLAAKKALQLLMVMKKDDSICDPSIVVYNAAIRTCAEAREIKMAFKLLQDALNRGLKPTIVTYGTLMTACERAVSVEGMDQVIQMMKKSNDSSGDRMVPNEIVYGAAISCLRKASQPDRAFNMLRKMVRDGLKPNIATFNTVLKAQTEGRKPSLENALEVYKMLKAANETTITPNRQTFAVLIEACCARKQPRGAEAFLRLMLKRGIQPDVDLYTMTVTAYEKARQPLQALRLMERMQTDCGYDYYSIAPLNTAFKNAVTLVNTVVGNKHNDEDADDDDDDDVLGEENWS